MAYNKLPKVELHAHLDGSCRLNTLRDMCRKDNLDKNRFPYDDKEKFREVVSLTKPQDSLVDFLRPFPDVCHILSTKENLSRQCMEFLEDQKDQNVVYCEVRVCPFLFCERGLTPDEVTKTLLEALHEAQNKYNVTVRVILCFLKPKPDWSARITDLAIQYKDREGVSVVGMDIAGDELAAMNQEHIDAFTRARAAGLHVTVHAAESGPAENVREAIQVLGAERIGHGYKVLEDAQIYQLAREKGIHFEACLTSSIFTNAAKVEGHAVKQFVKDNVNFGLNTDDSGIIGTSLNQEFEEAATKFGLTQDQLITSVYNSMRSSFIPKEEKCVLMDCLDKRMEKFKKQSHN